MAKITITVSIKRSWWQPWGDVVFSFQYGDKKIDVDGEQKPGSYRYHESTEGVIFPEIEVPDSVLDEFRQPKKQGLSHAAKVRKFLNTVCGPYIQTHTKRRIDIVKDENERFLSPATVFLDACNAALWINAIRQRPIKSLATSVSLAGSDAESKTALTPSGVALGAEAKATLMPHDAALGAEAKAAVKLPAVQEPRSVYESMSTINNALSAKRAVRTRSRWFKPIGKLLFLGLVGFLIYLSGGLGLLGLPLLYEALAVTGLLGTGAQGMTLLHSTTTWRKVVISAAIILSAIGMGVFIGLSGGALALIIAGSVAAAVTAGYFGGLFAWLRVKTVRFNPENIPFHVEADINLPEPEEKSITLAPVVEEKLPEKIVRAAGLKDEKPPEIKVPDVPVATLALGLKKRAESVAGGAAEVKAAEPLAQAMKKRVLMLDVDNTMVNGGYGKVWMTAPWGLLVSILIEEHQALGIELIPLICSMRFQSERDEGSVIPDLQTNFKQHIGKEIPEIYTSRALKSSFLKSYGGAVDSEIFGLDDREDVCTDLRNAGMKPFQTPYNVQTAAENSDYWRAWFLETVFPGMGIVLSEKSYQRLGFKEPYHEYAYKKAYLAYSSQFYAYDGLLYQTLSQAQADIQRYDTRLEAYRKQRADLWRCQDVLSFSQVSILELRIVKLETLKKKKADLMQQVTTVRNALKKQDEIKGNEPDAMKAKAAELKTLAKEMSDACAQDRLVLNATVAQHQQEESAVDSSLRSYDQAIVRYQAVFEEYKKKFANQIGQVSDVVDKMSYYSYGYGEGYQTREKPEASIQRYQALANEIKAINMADYDDLRQSMGADSHPPAGSDMVTYEAKRMEDARPRLEQRLKSLHDAMALKIQAAVDHQKAYEEYQRLFAEYDNRFSQRIVFIEKQIDLIQQRLAELCPDGVRQNDYDVRLGKVQVWVGVLSQYQALKREIEQVNLKNFDRLCQDIERYEARDRHRAYRYGYNRQPDAKPSMKERLDALEKEFTDQLRRIHSDWLPTRRVASFADDDGRRHRYREPPHFLSERRGWLNSEAYCQHGLMETASLKLAQRIQTQVDRELEQSESRARDHSL